MSDMRLDDDPLQGLVGNQAAWAAEFAAVGEILDQIERLANTSQPPPRRVTQRID